MSSNAPIFYFDWAPDAIIVTRLDRSVLHINPRAEDLFGYRKDELSDKPLELLIPEGLARAAPEYSLPQDVSRSVVCAHRNGTRFPGTARWRPAPAGDGEYVVFAIRDLYGDEGPVAGDSEKGPRIAPLSMFAHDVRESLQAVRYLCDALHGRAPAEAAAVNEIIESVCTLLERLTRFSEIHVLEPLVEPCRLGDLLNALGRELAPLAERKGLRLSVDGGDDAVTTDRVLLRELLHNLLANAIRYTDRGRIDVRCVAGSDEVRVDIIDTGVGIDPARLAAMLDASGGGASVDDRSRPHGAGFGFAIVHRLARLLECTLEADSTPGRGSRFTVVVPRDALSARSARSAR